LLRSSLWERPVTKVDRSLGPQNGERPLYGGLRP